MLTMIKELKHVAQLNGWTVGQIHYWRGSRDWLPILVMHFFGWRRVLNYCIGPAQSPLQLLFLTLGKAIQQRRISLGIDWNGFAYFNFLVFGYSGIHWLSGSEKWPNMSWIRRKWSKMQKVLVIKVHKKFKKKIILSEIVSTLFLNTPYPDSTYDQGSCDVWQI